MIADTPQLEHRWAGAQVLSDEHPDLVREEAVSLLCRQFMGAEVTAQIGVGLGERAPGLPFASGGRCPGATSTVTSPAFAFRKSKIRRARRWVPLEPAVLGALLASVSQEDRAGRQLDEGLVVHAFPNAS